MAFEMPAQASLTALTFRVRDSERALAFYRDLLGLSAATSDGEVRLSPAIPLASGSTSPKTTVAERP
ncbi:MAG: hypothetical protein ACRDHY_05015 [Anaerolineales bacterium]